LHHWQTALDILAGETSTATGAAPEKDAATRASNVKANAAAAADLPETPPPVSSLSSDFPPGFGCWPLGAVRKREIDYLKKKKRNRKRKWRLLTRCNGCVRWLH